MQSSKVVAVLAVFGLQQCVFGEGNDSNTTSMACDFDLPPPFPGYFWDETCTDGALGCLADGKNTFCRFCGAGNYSEIPCPPSSCQFPNEPLVPYYWDMDVDLVTWAAGPMASTSNAGSVGSEIPCPPSSCQFPNEPLVPYYWDMDCTLGDLGCWADGIHIQCRFCGEAPSTSLSCPAVVGGSIAAGGSSNLNECTFPNEPHTPYFWDPSCTNGQLGCFADGIHEECRFCAHRPFETVACPEGVGPDASQCFFTEGFEPKIEYFWDESCEMGKLGCWADGIHAKCRFCGSGAYHEVECPTVAAEAAASYVSA
eukprot:CAMPEP_0194782362 /NCGR_PEP_ID=MMETSP0323_2-20130528/78647_1 /TAXON_ID=2866 ORGANISM="Crypthecodinium cohnii, Strain Seligo" /NCGR_SAMPLE_ID=MMETSP0323_2 /ASSEMBLY_ACC=CAM_ASM_000346 /LENGTH=311 /DNA_ID=CAMNT_0039721169 /DNA_START=56 /DNA_END=988 /DNA_ORIENTATION=-